MEFEYLYKLIRSPMKSSLQSKSPTDWTMSDALDMSSVFFFFFMKIIIII